MTRSHALRSSLYTSVYETPSSGSDAGILVPTRRAHRYTHLTVGRNKPVRASAGPAFPAFRSSGAPETPTLDVAGRAYSGLHPVSDRLVYKDERAAWECGQGALRRESRATRLRIRDAARPALHSHVARGNEMYLNICV